MKILSINILNYKSCKKTVVDINSDMTALIGVNGAGKTNILLAIKLLMKIINPKFAYEKNNNESPYKTTIHAIFDNKGIELNLKVEFYYDYGIGPDEKISAINVAYKVPDLRKKWIFINQNLLYQLIYYSQTKGYSDSKFMQNQVVMQELFNVKEVITVEYYKYLFDIFDFIKQIQYYSATVFSNPHKSPVAVEFDDFKGGYLYRNERNRSPHEKFVADLISASKSNIILYEKYCNIVGPRGIGLIDSIEFTDVVFKTEEVNVKSGGAVDTKQRSKVVVVPKISIGKQTLSFNQLSEGTFKTLALIFYVIKNTESVLLIEEPEVCVHHGLLNSVIEIIKQESRTKQVIISTHSDYVLDHLDPEDLVIVSRTNEEGTKAKKLTKTLSKKEINALRKYLNEAGNLGEYWKEGGFDA